MKLAFQEREHSNLVQGEELHNVIIAIQAGTATLVPALTDVEPTDVPPADIPYDAPNLVSRERSIGAADFPMYDARNSITLRIPVLDLKRASYASIADMVLDAWVSPTAVELKIPVAIAKARKMQAEGRTLVTRERTTASIEKHNLDLPAMSSLRRASPWSRTLSFEIV